MKIIKVHPQGFCKGVIHAIKSTNEIIDNSPKPIYMLGEIVHNYHIANAYKEKGIILISSLNDIKQNKGSIIITAHGVSKKKYELIKKTGLNIIDTTCESVKQIQELVSRKIHDGYTIIYYGKQNHAECLAIAEDYENNCEFQGKFFVIQNKNDIESLKINNDKILFTNQTTMPYLNTIEITNILKLKYPNIIISIDICEATKQRQLALIKEAQNTDFTIIIGDKNSNNTLNLMNTCIDVCKKPCVLIENIEEIKNINFKQYNSISITSGASTPSILVKETIKLINDEKYESKINNDEYIKI